MKGLGGPRKAAISWASSPNTGAHQTGPPGPKPSEAVGFSGMGDGSECLPGLAFWPDSLNCCTCRVLSSVLGRAMGQADGRSGLGGTCGRTVTWRGEASPASLPGQGSYLAAPGGSSWPPAQPCCSGSPGPAVLEGSGLQGAPSTMVALERHSCRKTPATLPPILVCSTKGCSRQGGCSCPRSP